MRNRAWILVVALALVLAACASDTVDDTTGTSDAAESPATTDSGSAAATTEGPSDSGGTLVIGADAFGSSFVPAYTFQGWGHTWAINNMFETLYAFRSLDGVQPELATDYSVSDDGLTYTFALREDVVFHDGTPFNANAVVFNYMRYIDENHEYYDPNTVLAFLFLPGVEEVVATGEYEVAFNLSSPSATLVDALAHTWAGIMSPTAIMEAGTENAGLAPVGTGPYAFEKVDAGDRITLVGFEDHWKGAPPLDRVIIRAIPDEGTMLAALLADEVDLTSFVGYKDIGLLEDTDGIDVTVVPGAAVGYMPFNVAGSEGIEAFTDIRVRQAALHAIDRQRIIDTIFDGYGEIPSGFIPSVSWGYMPGLEDVTAYDPDRARELLAEAGGAPSITILVQSSGYWPRVAEIVQSDLADVGFDVSIEQIDSAAFYGRVSEGNQALWIGDGSYSTPDPTAVMQVLFGCENPRNLRFGGWCDPAFDELMAEQSVEFDQDARRDLIWQMEQILSDEAVMDVLYYQQFAYAISDRVTNFEPGPTRHLYLDETGVSG